MRQLLSILPPRMVSRKWTCQLSSFQTLPIAAAMPPSAMTVCALPSSDLQTSAVRTPCPEASMAARSPAPPAPMTMTSYSKLSYGSVAIRRPSRQEDPHVVNDAHGHQPHVDIGQPHPDQADPREQHVPLVQPRDRAPERVLRRRAGEDVGGAATE